MHQLTKGFKAPLGMANVENWGLFLTEAEARTVHPGTSRSDRQSTCSLQKEDSLCQLFGLHKERQRSVWILHGLRRKTAFVSFLVCIKNVKGLFEFHVASQDPPLKYLLPYKISQDHLNLFFCVIRASERGSNNPMAQQFSAAYKQLLMHHKPASSWTVLEYWSTPSRRHWTRVSDSSPNHTH